jgi:ribosomal protein L29
MKRQDIIKLHQLPAADLAAESQRLETQIAALRLTAQKGEVKNVHQLKELRQDFARVKTIIRHHALTGQPALPAQKKPATIKPVSKVSPAKSNKTTKA